MGCVGVHSEAAMIRARADKIKGQNSETSQVVDHKVKVVKCALGRREQSPTCKPQGAVFFLAKAKALQYF
jgi:hypothetical protein